MMSVGESLDKLEYRSARREPQGSIFQFLMSCLAKDIGQYDLVEVCNPEDYFAFREDEGKLMIESPGGEQWEYCSYEPYDGDIRAAE